MAMSSTLVKYLQDKGVEYEVLHHSYTATSMEAAQQAHIPGDQLAKSVILEDDKGYVMAVIPATHRLELGTLKWQFNRRLRLATEMELPRLFGDCVQGACPPVGEAYGIDVLMDERLSAFEDIYFDAGDRMELIHVRGQDFEDLMSNAHRGYFSWHV